MTTYTLANVQHFPHVNLWLTGAYSSNVPSRSGLNWGQRPGRDPNQAYLSVRKNVHRQNPGFFPRRANPFTMYTDDGRMFTCVIAQDNNKAIETPNNNSILGSYFRQRLGVPSGDRVYTHHLDNYGRRFVTIYKMSNTEYFLDFH